MTPNPVSFALTLAEGGQRPQPGWTSGPDSPFVVYQSRASGRWKVAHRPTGYSVESLLSARVVRTRDGLLDYMQRLEAAEPEAVAMMHLVDGIPMAAEYRAYGQRLWDWAKGQNHG